MKIPLSWLKEYIDLPHSANKIASSLTEMGIEVENIEQPPIHFEGVVTCEILSVKPHPNAERLQIASVTDGIETAEVVCGARNCRSGIKTAWAKVGASLMNQDGKKIKIKKAKLRDIESNGMLCALDELSLADTSEGIVELPLDTPNGLPLANLYEDPIFDLSFTPNLGHALSVLGIARELSAKYEQKLLLPKPLVQENPSCSIHDLVKVDVRAKKECRRYSCRLIQNIHVTPSPSWLKKRLEQVGQKSINYLVDIANFVMLETGQPLHIFDADKIQDLHIFVELAEEEGKIALLDGTEALFPKGTLLIKDREKPLALAGIMGGASSAVSPSTKNILIESAYFDPSTIRKTCKHLHLRSEASYRFERDVDQDGVLYALDRAVTLIGEPSAKGCIDQISIPIQKRKILCRIEKLNALLGLSLSRDMIIHLFQRLFMEVRFQGETTLEVTIPSYRNDIHIEEDLFEEAARLYGYSNIPQIRPKYTSSTLPDAPLFLFEEKMRALLAREGLEEALFCDLISEEEAKTALERGLDSSCFIRVLHPSSIEQSVLRPSLLPSFLRNAKFAQDRGSINIHLFEIGKIHFLEQGKYREKMAIGIALKGLCSLYHFATKPATFDFFHLKGIVENILSSLSIHSYEIRASHLHALHPVRQAELTLDNRSIAVFGEIHPVLLSSFGIKEPLLFAELDLEDLLFFSARQPKHFTPLPIYPGSERDWTITLSSHVPLETLLRAIQTSSSPLLKGVSLLDIYESKELGPLKKNVTLRFLYQDAERTVDFEKVDLEHSQLMEQVRQKIGSCVL